MCVHVHVANTERFKLKEARNSSNKRGGSSNLINHCSVCMWAIIDNFPAAGLPLTDQLAHLPASSRVPVHPVTPLRARLFHGVRTIRTASLVVPAKLNRRTPHSSVCCTGPRFRASAGSYCGRTSNTGICGLLVRARRRRGGGRPWRSERCPGHGGQITAI